MAKKKKKLSKTYGSYNPGDRAEDLEHWVCLMHEWAKQVTRDIRRIKACKELQDCLKKNAKWSDHRLKSAEKKVDPKANPDDPPQPPWGFQ